MNISPVIIVKNAARTIAQTLESLKEFDEVVVYDTGSNDETMEIARLYENVKLCKGKFSGFGKSKNKAAVMAKNNWVFSIDADEVVSPQLMNSIRSLKLNDLCVYRLKRYNYYRKRRIRYSGWGQEHVIRIYNKSRIAFNEKLVHEHIEVENYNIITLEGELRHFSYSSVSDFIQKRDLYSELFAQENLGKRKSSPLTAVLHATFDFFNTFFFKAAFFDGYRGLLIAVLNANVSFYKYLKLYEANIRNDAKVSLILLLDTDCSATVNRLINSALYQTVTPDEIILATNPLSKETMEIIEKYAKRCFIPIYFSWQNGWNHKTIEPCNMAISQATCEYLIFVEGKGILHKNFVHDHLKYSKKGFYIQGSNISIDHEPLNDFHGIPKIKHFLSKIIGTTLFCVLRQKLNFFKNQDTLQINVSFFKDELFNLTETESGVVDFDKVKADLFKKLTYSRLNKRSLRFSGIHYQFPVDVKSSSNSNKKVLICLDRLKHPNCGLGQVSIGMGRKLTETKIPGIDFSFLLPAEGFSEFDNKIDNIRLYAYRYFFTRYMKKFDVCHVTHQIPSYRFGGAKRNILTIHDLNFLYKKSKSKKQRYLRKLQENIYKSDAIAFISKFTREVCYKYLDIPSDKITRVIYNGVTPPIIGSEKPAWLNRDKFLFSIGQFLEKKNFHILLPFIKLLPDDITLVIAGENKTHYGNKMFQLLEEQKLTHRVIMPGGISDLQKNYLYLNCMAFVFPSVAEGFGLPIIEAMLSNKPVFCSNRTSLEEIGGEFAFFWTDFDPENMVNVFNKGLETFTDKQFRQRQLEYASTFTQEKNINEYIKIYKELITLKDK